MRLDQVRQNQTQADLLHNALVRVEYAGHFIVVPASWTDSLVRLGFLVSSPLGARRADSAQ